MWTRIKINRYALSMLRLVMASGLAMPVFFAQAAESDGVEASGISGSIFGALKENIFILVWIGVGIIVLMGIYFIWKLLQEDDFEEKKEQAESIHDSKATEDGSRAAESEKKDDNISGTFGIEKETTEEVGGKWTRIMPWALLIVVLVGVAVLIPILMEKSRNKEAEKTVSIISLCEADKSDDEQSPVDGLEAAECPKCECSQEKNTGTGESAHSAEIKILNGGAAVGSAGKMKDFLSGKGYSKVDFANASQKSYTGVTVFYKTGSGKLAADVLSDLLEQNTNISIQKGSTAEETSSNIVIMLGK